MTSNEQYINILSVYNKVRELYINDENLVSAIREAYLGGMQKKALIEKYLPVEFEKSINVSIMIINDILKGISENERKKIAEERQIANLLLQNSVQQSARGKIGGTKKQLSEKKAQEMKQAAVWTNKQKQFVRNAYRDTLQYPTSFTRDERIKKITEVLNTTFQTNKTPSAVRGAIERTRKDLERGLQKPAALSKRILQLWDERETTPLLIYQEKEYNIKQSTLWASYQALSDYILDAYKIEKSARAIEGIIKWRNGSQKRKSCQ